MYSKSSFALRQYALSQSMIFAANNHQFKYLDFSKPILFSIIGPIRWFFFFFQVFKNNSREIILTIVEKSQWHVIASLVGKSYILKVVSRTSRDATCLLFQVVAKLERYKHYQHFNPL